MELGITTFAEMPLNLGDDIARISAERLQHVVQEAELADRLGLDVYGVGEHHRPDFIASSPATVLAAIAARTQRIRLTSAVTVLSSDDPVRVYQDFATLDLLSNGRAEIMAGRGSFTESFPLFGQSLDDYDELFAEKLELLLAVRAQERVTWRGQHRPPIKDRGVYPRALQNPLPVWIAVGGTPQSIVRAGVLGLPLMLAIIGGEPARFAPLVAMYRNAARRAGHDPAKLQVGINSHCWLAEDSQQAADEFWPAYSETMSRIGRERGWPPMSREAYDQLRGPAGSLLVGTPEEVAAKIRAQRELFGCTRYLVQFTVGPMPHEQVMRCIELFAQRCRPALGASAASR
jgi:probable LLM family oxidoreductase